MPNTAKEQYETIQKLITHYQNARVKQIDETPIKNFTPAPSISSDDIIKRLNLLAYETKKLNDKINQLIEEDEKNKTFYQTYRNNIFELILTVNTKYKNEGLLDSDFKQTPVTIKYKRGGHDFLPVVAYWSLNSIQLALCVGLIGAVFAASILWTGFVLHAALSVSLIAMAAVLLLTLALASTIVLLGLIAGVGNYLTSNTPLGSAGDELQHGRKRNSFFQAGQNPAHREEEHFTVSNLQTLFIKLDTHEIEAYEVELNPDEENQRNLQTYNS